MLPTEEFWLAYACSICRSIDQGRLYKGPGAGTPPVLGLAPSAPPQVLRVTRNIISLRPLHTVYRTRHCPSPNCEKNYRRHCYRYSCLDYIEVCRWRQSQSGGISLHLLTKYVRLQITAAHY
jgi:hypothetical protein